MLRPKFTRFFFLVLTKINNKNKDFAQLGTSLDYIPSEYLPLGWWEVNRGAMLSTLSLSCIWKDSLQSTRFLFLISFLSGNERREVNFKSQKYSLLKSVSGTVQKYTFLVQKFVSLAESKQCCSEQSCRDRRIK